MVGVSVTNYLVVSSVRSSVCNDGIAVLEIDVDAVSERYHGGENGSVSELYPVGLLMGPVHNGNNVSRLDASIAEL